MPLVRRTRATLRSAEFGFFGVWVKTRTHTPRFWGLFCRAGLLVFHATFSRPLRTNWLIVGTVTPDKKDKQPTHGTPFSTENRHARASARCSRPREPHGGPAPGTDLPYLVYVRAPRRVRAMG